MTCRRDRVAVAAEREREWAVFLAAHHAKRAEWRELELWQRAVHAAGHVVAGRLLGLNEPDVAVVGGRALIRFPESSAPLGDDVWNDPVGLRRLLTMGMAGTGAELIVFGESLDNWCPSCLENRAHAIARHFADPPAGFTVPDGYSFWGVVKEAEAMMQRTDVIDAAARILLLEQAADDVNNMEYT